jgi:hypothetical protein
VRENKIVKSEEEKEKMVTQEMIINNLGLKRIWTHGTDGVLVGHRDTFSVQPSP